MVVQLFTLSNSIIDAVIGLVILLDFALLVEVLVSTVVGLVILSDSSIKRTVPMNSLFSLNIGMLLLLYFSILTLNFLFLLF